MFVLGFSVVRYPKQIPEYIYAAWQKAARGIFRVFIIDSDGNVSESEYLNISSFVDVITFTIKYFCNTAIFELSSLTAILR